MSLIHRVRPAILKVLIVLSLGIVGRSEAQDTGTPDASECTQPECIATPECETDAECSEDMSCIAHLSCIPGSDFGCRDGESDQDCVDRTQALRESSCGIVDKHICYPVWALGCEEDSDCPGGFTCTGVPGNPCEPIDSTCEVDTDCPGGWLCRTYDAGFCDRGPDCVGNQRHATSCLPPRIEGNAAASGAALGTASAAATDHDEQPTKSRSSGCNVGSVVGDAPDRTVLLATLLAAAWVARRRRVSCRDFQ